MWNYIVGIIAEKFIAVIIRYVKAAYASVRRKKVIEQAKSDYVSATTDADKEKAFEELVQASDPNSTE